MKRAELERMSVRVALAVGFLGTLGLWLYTNEAFTRRIETAQLDAAQIATRYIAAQDSMATVRAQVLSSSVRVRDALLDPTPAALQQCREQLAVSTHIINGALADYVPVFQGTADSTATSLTRLSSEVALFHDRAAQALTGAAGRTAAQVRDVLNDLMPHRDAALSISEDIQAINRRGFVRRQEELAALHRGAEAESRDRVRLALVIGLGTLLLTSAYAGRLEARLRAQLERDARISSELQQTAAKVLNAQEEERRTIARELHDEVGQALTAIRVELDVAERAIGSAGASVLTEAQTITDGALQTVRNLTQLLHPAALDDLGLPAVIDAALRGLKRRYNIRGTLEQVDLPPRLPREIELAAYRIVQEGITNVAKHARATRCDVRLTQLPDRLLVEVEDDGIGFVEDTDRPIVARGLGLVSIRERASRLGGTFNILSRPGAGTRLIVSLPEKNFA